MAFDVSSQQVALWLACTTRGDIRGTLLSTPNNYSQAQKQYLERELGFTLNDPGVQAMINLLASAQIILGSISGTFEAILQQLLQIAYTPPNCPANAQVNCIAKLECTEDPAEAELNQEVLRLMLHRLPPLQKRPA